ncbi:MAG: hypothetical protein QXT64_07720 [Desulfurococcaceae archaeon]
MGLMGFPEYATRVLELFGYVFEPMYGEIFRRYWHDNRECAYMPKAYVRTEWKSNRFETYIPVITDAGTMKYYRIAVKVVEEVDNKSKKQYWNELKKPLLTPNGQVSEETLVIVSQKRHGEEFVSPDGKNRSFKTVFISRVPEIAVKRVLCVLAKFLESRIKGMLDKLHIEVWQIANTAVTSFTYLYRSLHSIIYNTVTIIERLSSPIKRFICCISKSYDWLLKKVRELNSEIGRQDMIKSKIVFKTVKQLRGLVEAFKQIPEPVKSQSVPDPQVVMYLEKALAWVESRLREDRLLKILEAEARAVRV